MARTSVLPAACRRCRNWIEPVLGTRIEAGGRLIEEQHLGIRGEDGGESDFLLLAARQAVGRPLGQGLDAEEPQRVGDALLDLGPLQAKVQRPEGDLVAHRGVEELHVGALEHHADAATERLRPRLVPED